MVGVAKAGAPDISMSTFQRDASDLVLMLE